jgi:hypothetical protein
MTQSHTLALIAQLESAAAPSLVEYSHQSAVVFQDTLLTPLTWCAIGALLTNTTHPLLLNVPAAQLVLPLAAITEAISLSMLPQLEPVGIQSTKHATLAQLPNTTM